MKKLILLFSAVSLILNSCSSDADPLPVYTPPVVGPINNVVDNGSLLKRITYSDGSYDSFTYSGQKLVSIINSDNIENVYYTYNGNNISKAELKDGTGTVIMSIIYTYDSNNKLIQELEYDDSFGGDIYTKSVFTYNADGTVKSTNYTGNASAQTTFAGYDISYFDSNKNNTKFENFDSSNNLYVTETYEFDTKYCPFKNIVGFNRIYGVVHSVLGLNNNITKETITFAGSSPSSDNYSYIYNANNYPTSSNDSGDVTTFTYY